MEVHGGDECPKEVVTPPEAQAAAGLWQGLWIFKKRSLHWSRSAGRTHDPVGDPQCSSLLLKNFTPWKGHTLEQQQKCNLWKRFTLEKLMEDCVL
ncbi:hypothetical protein HGM15179_010238 [Zosterops borbonicus]|uniref:Uncharacterized protein n=1 Tax=Zosterops borbonicus TaxID=364589 RepID=A0A8K1GFP5_9PASS|nr:hypothetical protein HGM15179_010238 [Zosterops borbonicus]